jgi:hypothetical protein
VICYDSRSAHYGFGALGSALQAYSDASNGDPAEAAIDSTEALGNFPNAIKPLVPQLVKHTRNLLISYRELPAMLQAPRSELLARQTP